MIGNSITLAGGSVLKLVNEGNYSSEYLLKTDATNTRLRIRHTVESQKINGVGVDRHNVTLTRNIFPYTDEDGVYPAKFVEASIVIRTPSEGSADDVLDILASLADFVSTNGSAIAGWES